MKEFSSEAAVVADKPILLYDDECGVCRSMARWVRKSARGESGKASIIVRPIGQDPEALRLLNPDLGIGDAYATSHLVMPDGSMKLGGEAVAEVLRSCPGTRRIARSFAIRTFGFRPFQLMLDMAYAILSDVRPILGCESCGAPRLWMRPIAWMVKAAKNLLGDDRRPSPSPHFSSLAPSRRRPNPSA